MNTPSWLRAAALIKSLCVIPSTVNWSWYLGVVMGKESYVSFIQYNILSVFTLIKAKRRSLLTSSFNCWLHMWAQCSQAWLRQAVESGGGAGRLQEQSVKHSMFRREDVLLWGCPFWNISLSFFPLIWYGLSSYLYLENHSVWHVRFFFMVSLSLPSFNLCKMAVELIAFY